MPVTNKKAIIIAGPTAVGKTAIAIAIAQHFNTSIISADSRQCYKELNIGVARPSEQELALVDHYFIASHSIQDEVNAGSFESYALNKANELWQQHDTIILVGGTGLYIKAFCEGLDTIPAVDPAIRARVVKDYESNGIEWLRDQLRVKDPHFYEKGEIKNPQRMMRALEVIESTGNSVLFYRKGEKAVRDFDIIKLGIELPKAALHENINHRVDQMITNGLVDEVKKLIPYKHLNALQTVGYSEIFDYLDEQIGLELAIDKIKINTRQYAKRQLTWFKKDKEINWFAPGSLNNMLEYINHSS